jgi:hypothetical protein
MTSSDQKNSNDVIENSRKKDERLQTESSCIPVIISGYLAKKNTIMKINLSEKSCPFKKSLMIMQFVSLILAS